MLLMATYTDARETNPVIAADRDEAFRQVLSNAGKHGVRIHGMYVEEAGYTVYFLFEAESIDQINAVFAPVLAFGQLESVPVIDRLAL